MMMALRPFRPAAAIATVASLCTLCAMGEGVASAAMVPVVVKAPAKTSVAFLTANGTIATSVTLRAHSKTSVPVVLANIGGSPSAATANPQLSFTLPPAVSLVRLDTFNTQKTQLSFHCSELGSTYSCVLVSATSHGAPVIAAQSYVLAALVLQTQNGFPVRQLSLGATGSLAGGGVSTASVVVNAKAGVGA